MTKPYAAIDIGSNTARLLIAGVSKSGEQLHPIDRKRAYIRLAESLERDGKKMIPADGLERTIHALNGFLVEIRAHKVRATVGVATGVMRDACNQEDFLVQVRERTGLNVRLVTGDQEAFLTARGVLSGLAVGTAPVMVFDLGGGSTEFFLQYKETHTVWSLPLGAAVLTHQFLDAEPPALNQIDLLAEHIDSCLHKLDSSPKKEGIRVAGTGGTVTTLALMINQMPPTDHFVTQVNGAILTKEQIEELFDRMRRLNLAERRKLPGLDRERAPIIPAGCLVVIRLLRFLKAHHLTVSVSDLLEGIILQQFNGEFNEQ